MDKSPIKSIFAAALCAALASSCGGGSFPKGVRRFLDGMVPVPGTDFLAGKHEVTQREWKSVMGENPVWDDHRKGDDLPVVCVSFLDCEAFVRKLNEQAEAAGLDVRFRLPSAAEWTMASGGERFADPAYARFSEGSFGKPDPGKLQPNEHGLFDMFGDVAEWTSDYLGDPGDPDVRPSLAMGGHWGVPGLRGPAFVKGTFAEYRPRGDADIKTGFRLFASKGSDAKPFVPPEIASVMEKAKAAAAQGGVAFCGFYPGMSRADAERLAGYYWFDVADVDYSFLGDPVRLVRLSPAAAEIAMGVDLGFSDPDVYLEHLKAAVSQRLVLRNAEDIRLLKRPDWLNMCWMGTWDWDVTVTVAVMPVRHLNVEPGVILKCPAESAAVLADPATADRARAEIKARKEREAEELFTKREREIGKKRADAGKELDAILEIQDDVRNASGWQGAYLVSEYCKALGVRFDEDDPEGTGFRLGNRLKEEEKKFRAMLDEADRELEELEASMPPALAERLAAERKAREEREAAERRAKEEREAAERRAKAEREAREAAERKAREAREAAERKAREEREAAERKAREEREAAERKAREAAKRKAQQESHAAALAWKSESKTIPLSNGVSIELKSVPGGLWFGKHEVTKAQWDVFRREIAGLESRYTVSPIQTAEDLTGPITQVSWYDCQKYLEKLNAFPAVRKSGLTFRLPTEDEWEAACRAGATGDYCLLADGTEITEETLGRVAWFESNSRHAQPGGRKEPNVFGLYDMHGNVREWTSTADGESYVCRGGSSDDDARLCKSSPRCTESPSARLSRLGFRLCADFDSSKVPTTTNGLIVRYYDVRIDRPDRVMRSESSARDFFASRTPSQTENTRDWGDTLTPAFIDSGLDPIHDRRRIKAGLAPLEYDHSLFHGKYANGSQDYFATVLSGVLRIDEPGTYSFGVLADDYIAVFVDGRNVCSARWEDLGTGSVSLSAGDHAILIAHYEFAGGQGLCVQWKKPGDDSFEPVPQSVLIPSEPWE